jgi:hypothetical protein
VSQEGGKGREGRETLAYGPLPSPLLFIISSFFVSSSIKYHFSSLIIYVSPHRCMYDDHYLALRYLRRATGGRVRRALYIDLDVHQGQGVARDKMRFKDEDLIIMDVYNGQARAQGKGEWNARAYGFQTIFHFYLLVQCLYFYLCHFSVFSVTIS